MSRGICCILLLSGCLCCVLQFIFSRNFSVDASLSPTLYPGSNDLPTFSYNPLCSNNATLKTQVLTYFNKMCKDYTNGCGNSVSGFMMAAFILGFILPLPAIVFSLVMVNTHTRSNLFYAIYIVTHLGINILTFLVWFLFSTYNPIEQCLPTSSEVSTNGGINVNCRHQYSTHEEDLWITSIVLPNCINTFVDRDNYNYPILFIKPIASPTVLAAIIELSKKLEWIMLANISGFLIGFFIFIFTYFKMRGVANAPSLAV
jgi:hypothetical protein